MLRKHIRFEAVTLGILVLLIVASALSSQTVNGTISRFTSDPAAQPCTFRVLGMNVTAKSVWACDLGAWFRPWAAPGPPTAADQVVTSSASGTAAWGQINSGNPCGDGTHALNYSNISHLVGCQTLTGGGGGGGYPDVPTLTAPPSVGWTWENQGGSTVSALSNFLHFEFAFNAGSIRTYYRTAPATPYTVTVLIRHQMWNVLSAPTNTGDSGIGISFRDGTGKLIVFYLFSNSGNSTTRGLFLEKWTNFSTFSAAYTIYGPNNPLLNVTNNSSLIWLQEKDDGVNLTWSTSIDGQNWQQFDQRARTNFLGAGPTLIGVSFRSTGAGDTGAVANLLSWTN